MQPTGRVTTSVDDPPRRGQQGVADEPGATRWGARQLCVEVAVAFAVAGALAVAVTWPLALDIGSLVSNAADAPFQAWTIDWVQWAITGPGALFDANIFAPNDNTLAYSDSLLGLAVPLLPLRWLGLNPIAQLNVALLVGTAASAASGYLFGRVVSGSPAGGAAAAAAFSFGPFATVTADQLHATVHPGVAVAAAGMWWLADRARGRRSLVVPGVLVATATLWQMSVSFYPGTYAVVAALVVAACRWRDLGRRGAVAATAALAAVVAGTLVLALPYLAVAREGPEFVRDADEVAKLGADFTKADARLELWGPHLSEPFSSTPAFPGLVLLVFSVVGAVVGIRRGGRDRRTVQLALVFVAVGAFLALGTSGHGWRAYSPYRLLFEFIPVFRILRGAARAWILGLLGIGLLAGLGAAQVGRALGRRSPQRAVAVVTALAVAGVAVEGWSSWDGRPRATASPVDEALATRPEEGGVLYLPAFSPGPLEFATTFGQVPNVYGTTAHHRRTPNGYSGLTPDEWPEISARMEELPSPDALQELREIGVRFVVVRDGVQGTPWERLLDPKAARPLELVGRYGEDALYEVPDA